MDERQLLRDAEIYPATTVLAEALGQAMPAYQRLEELLQEAGITTEWRYYNDGKAWLLKAVYKKKTVLWLSVWKNYFKVSFFFTEKTRTGIANLAIADELKAAAAVELQHRKYLALVLEITSEQQLADLTQLVEYKKQLK